MHISSNSLKDSVHRKLKTQMVLLGISQVEIAKKLEKKLKRPMSRQMVNHVVMGRVKSKTLRMAICAELKMDPPESWN